MKRILYITGILLSASLWTHAQEGQLINVKVINESVTKNGREVNVKMTLDLTDMEIGNQKSVRLKPIIVAKTDSKELELPPVVVDGRTRNRIHKRMKALTGKSTVDDAYMVVRRKSNKKQNVEYSMTLPYEPWMAQSRLILREEMTGCLECEAGTLATEESLVKSTFLQLFQPQYVTTFVQPEKETIKVRNEIRAVRLQYRQNTYIIDPKFKNNQAKLDSVHNSIEVVKTNPDLTITGIYITGYASPEGTVAYNEHLSKNRAENFAQYMQKDTNVDASLWHVTWKGEDWNGLRKEVLKHPKLLKIDEVIKIIDECEDDQDVCEQRIKDLVPPEIYQRLLNEMYGPLRRNEYRIEYNVKEFSLEEAKKQLKIRPDLLSMEEIYMVADSYGKDSSEYKEVLLIAAHTYPDKTSAIVNGANMEMERNNIAAAISMIEKSKAVHTPEALNCLGVAYAKNKQYDKAKEALKRATDAGNMEAKINLEQLARVIADL